MNLIDKGEQAYKTAHGSYTAHLADLVATSHGLANDLVIGLAVQLDAGSRRAELRRPGREQRPEPRPRTQREEIDRRQLLDREERFRRPVPRLSMGKLVVTEFVTLDGVFQDPGGYGEFERGGWAFQFDQGDEGAKFKFDELLASDAQLLGRVTYEGFAKAWPTMEGTGEFGEKMNAMPKFVVSTTLENPDWNNTTVLKR